MRTTTYLGLVLGVGVVYYAVLAKGGDMTIFTNVVALLIAVGGTFAATTLSSSRMTGVHGLSAARRIFLTGSTTNKALERVRSSATALPDFAVAHAFLGSMYFLFDQKDAAVRAWRRSYELDPTNEAVKAALQEYGRKEKKQPASTPKR